MVTFKVPMIAMMMKETINYWMITFKVLSSMLIIAIFSEFPVLLFATIFN